MTEPTLHELGRALAAEREAKLDTYDTPDAEAAAVREAEIGREIERRGGWNDDVERGYLDARAEYARERYA
jgi:hypothetical protein